LVSAAVAKPAYWRIVQNRERYIVAWTLTREPEVGRGIQARDVIGGVDVGDGDLGGGRERIAALRGGAHGPRPGRCPPALDLGIRAAPAVTGVAVTHRRLLFHRVLR
jgi:hypothetical protein